MSTSSASRLGAGVLFDMDGVLVATEELKDRAHSATVRHFGGVLRPEIYKNVMGRSQTAVVRTYIEVHELDVQVADYSERFRELYEGLLRTRLELVPGAVALVGALLERDYRLALVSSSLRWMVHEVLSQTGLASVFEAVISADDVQSEKPSPAPYQRALSLLSLEPARAVVIEDTESGIEAGRCAGVRVIALRHSYNAQHDLSNAYAVLSSLEDTEAILASIASALER